MKIKTMSILLPAALILSGCAAAGPENPQTAAVPVTTQSAAETLSASGSETAAAADTSRTQTVTSETSAQSAASMTEGAAQIAEETPETFSVSDKSAAAREADCISPAALAQGDVISIAVSTNFIDYSIRYENVIFLKDESTAGTLYFKAVNPGKDNIVVSENSENGIIRTEYIAVINDDLTAVLYVSGGADAF